MTFTLIVEVFMFGYGLQMNIYVCTHDACICKTHILDCVIPFNSNCLYR